MAVAVIAYFLLPDFPEDAEWLAADEKEFFKARLFEDVGSSHDWSCLQLGALFEGTRATEAGPCFVSTHATSATVGCSDLEPCELRPRESRCLRGRL